MTDTSPLTGTEQAVFGAGTVADLRHFLSVWAEDELGSPVADVVFRAGRIDVVWGVELAGGRAVVIKIHRPPVELEALQVAQEAQRQLAAAGFPCSAPLVPVAQREGRVLTAEALVTGQTPDGTRPVVRNLLAAGLARQVEILRQCPDLIARAGRGPSWCRYADGPWPTPHDTLVDFSATPPDHAWLDDFGQRAADQILANRDAETVVGHADWYAGNTAVVDGRLVGTFDWELVADTEAVIAGFAAACFAASSTGPDGLSGPGSVAAFLRDYELAAGRAFTATEQRAAAGAAAWIVAFNARWQVGLIPHGISDEATIALARDLGPDFLAVAWSAGQPSTTSVPLAADS